MMDNDFDCIIFIEGKRGVGKSTLGQKIAYKSKTQFKPKRDLAFTRDNVIRLLGEKRKGIIFGDELINVAYNRDFWDQDQKTLIKALNMYRDRCNLFIGCIPFFVDLDKQMQKLCKIRITVLRRGYALLQFQTKTLYSNDPWDVNNNRKIENKFRAGKMKYSKFSTVKGIVKFNDLTPNQKRLYIDIKEEKRNQVFEQYAGEIEESNPITKLYDRVKLKQVSRQALELHCQILGLKIKTIRTQLNNMLKDEGLPGTLQEYVLDEKAILLSKIKEKSSKKSKKFELMAKKSEGTRDMLLLEPPKDDHIKMKYQNPHVWAK